MKKEININKMKQERKPEGYWLSIGASFGILFGLLFGIPFENSAIGLLIGVMFGLLFGYAMEKRFNPYPIKLTSKQKKLRVLKGIIIFIIAFIIAFIFSFIFSKI